MVLNIYASALNAGDAGELLVIVTAFPAEPGGGIGTFQNRTGVANDLIEAKTLAERLAASLQDELERLGHRIHSVNLRV